MTHRGTASAFVVVSGHAEEAYRPVLESLPPSGITVVVMMGLGRIDRIAALLVDRGWPAMTPAAIVFGASTAASDVWTMTLRELQQGIDATESGKAGTVVVGEVVRLRAVLAAGVEDDEIEAAR